MTPRDHLASLLAPYAPRLLDASARGTGWNSVWRLTYGGGEHVLKVYGRRRGRLREWVTHLTQRLAGRTGYTARARRATEERLLRLWREAAFDCPALETPPAGFPSLPAPFLVMEYLPGPSLRAVLADPATEERAAESLFRRFVREAARRHAAALERREPALLQEHPGLDHCLVSGDRLAVFDLETAFTDRTGAEDAVAAEIAGLARSLVRSLPAERAARLLAVLAVDYPDRHRLRASCARLMRHPDRWRRLMQTLDRSLLRGRNRFDKYAASTRLAALLEKETAGRE